MSEVDTDAQEQEAPSIESLVEMLGSPRRRLRQEASHQLAIVAKDDPEMLGDFVGQLVEALTVDEAQTRWEVLDALAELAMVDVGDVGGACEPAEISLFDESSSAARLAAFKFLARYGERSAELSDQVWDIMDEAIQCYHGDPEYRDMLTCLLEFVRGDISDETRDALVARVAFDAENGRGYIKSYSAQIVELAQGEDA